MTSERACDQHCGGSDLVASRLGWLLWGGPTFLFLLGTAWGAARSWLWIPALVIAGFACVANASRCGRLHCFVTGPLFLLGALATLLDATGLVPMDWRWVLVAVVVGTVAGYGLEWVRGRYVEPRSANERTNAGRSAISP